LAINKLAGKIARPVEQTRSKMDKIFTKLEETITLKEYQKILGVERAHRARCQMILRCHLRYLTKI